MMNFLAQAKEPVPPSFWNTEATNDGIFQQPGFWWWIIVLFATILLLFVISKVPSNFRKPITLGLTFLAGLFYILVWLWPKATDADGKTVMDVLPGNFYFNLNEAIPRVAGISQIIEYLLLTIGIVGICRLHFKRIFKGKEEAFYSFILIAGMVFMIIFGYLNFHMGTVVASMSPEEKQAAMDASFGVNAFNFLFVNLYNNLESAMFSTIAFFILSAAYRAFRVRSVEASILMATALVVLLSFIPLGLALTDNLDAHSFAGNFRIDSIGDWILATINTPALRAIDLGLGLGSLAMALRIILGLERGIVSD